MKVIAKATAVDVQVLTDAGEVIYRYQATNLIVQLDANKLIAGVVEVKDAVEKALADALAK